MKATWRTEPDERPSFTQLAGLMGALLEGNVKQVYFLPSTSVNVPQNSCCQLSEFT